MHACSQSTRKMHAHNLLEKCQPIIYICGVCRADLDLIKESFNEESIFDGYETSIWARIFEKYKNLIINCLEANNWKNLEDLLADRNYNADMVGNGIMEFIQKQRIRVPKEIVNMALPTRLEEEDAMKQSNNQEDFVLVLPDIFNIRKTKLQVHHPLSDSWVGDDVSYTTVLVRNQGGRIITTKESSFPKRRRTVDIDSPTLHSVENNWNGNTNSSIQAGGGDNNELTPTNEDGNTDSSKKDEQEDHTRFLGLTSTKGSCDGSCDFICSDDNISVYSWDGSTW